MLFVNGPQWPLLCGALGAVLGGLLAAGAAFGGINVSAGGQASYGLPIAVPPGIAGMAPNLSLSYVDGGINGPLGVGWSVQGISAITRCPATRVTDGAARPVGFDGQDKLCLDGQRLIQTDASGVVKSGQIDDALGGPNGVIVREYRTEKDMFARIRAYGTALADPLNSTAVANGPDNGPQYFKVWTKSGQVYEYGTNPAVTSTLSDKSTIYANGRNAVAVWAVRRISDVVGNYMDFKYHLLDTAWGSGTTASGSVGREWGIAEIQYTGNKTAGLTDQAPVNKVVFSYEPKPTTSGAGFDRGEAYQWDSKNVSTYRINAIRAYVNSPNPGALGPASNAVMVRAYRLNYEVSPSTGRSRLFKVAECSGPAGAETKCLPPTVLSYTNAGTLNFAANTSFGGSGMSTLPMTSTDGEYGVLMGDFNGDGRTDILRWSRTTSMNELWLSNGDGTFTKSLAFNLTGQNLNGSNFGTNDGCYVGMVADFNGDGLSDILRVAKPSCSSGGNLLFLSAGDGSFTTVVLPVAMDLQQVLSKRTSVSAPCIAPTIASPVGGVIGRGAVVPPSDNFGPGAAGVVSGRLSTAVSSQVIGPALLTGTCTSTSRPLGKRIYLLDMDGDGILDIVTTVAVNFSWNSNWGPIPSEDSLCAGNGNPSFTGPCSRVWRGSATGTFTEQTTNIVNTSVYSDPPDPKDKSNPYWRWPNQADINGDGLQDILAKYTGRWRSMGDFNFTGSPVHDTSQLCGMPIDFNGDGRTDCLFPDTVAANQNLTLSYGAATSAPIVQFNLTGPADNLYAVNASGVPTVGVLVEDYDGDGRQDILRWGQTPSENGVYLSNGDGSFRPRVSAGLGSINRPLQAVDGSTTFALGDFLGIGAIQILHLKNNPTANSPAVDNGNQLYFRSGQPVDVLYTATTSTGLVSTVGPRVPLSNSGGVYVNERGTAQAAVSPIVDIQAPMYVISSLTNQTGTPTDLITNYVYKGLKAERGGRGMLGFREVQQRNAAPNGTLQTVATEYLLTHPYSGVAAVAKTYVGTPSALPGQLISQTTNLYCDKTSPVSSPSVSAPCPTTAKVTLPYLLSTEEKGWDLGNSILLPTVTTTNAFNMFGDPTLVVVTTVGNLAGTAWTSTKTTTSTFCDPKTDSATPTCAGVAGWPNNIAADNWVLGRLSKTTVNNVVPNTLSTLTVTAGQAPKASAITGP